jgi:hypothetical protein
MKWMRERDALIAQTLAFVQSVTGRRDKPLPPVGPDESGAQVAPADIAPVPANIEPPSAVAGRARTIVASELKRELAARIESFRAHQERFNREREEYFKATLTNLRAAIKDAPPPSSGE